MSIFESVPLAWDNCVMVLPVTVGSDITSESLALAYDIATNGIVQGRVFRFGEANSGANIAGFAIMG